MSTNNSSEVKVSKSSYELAEKLITLNKLKQNKNNEQKQQINRKIGSTDYAKYEAMAKEIEREDIMSKKDILNAPNPNDYKKQRQMIEGATKPRIEACMIFKTEGDYYLKQKKYNEAINSYEKALLQLFINFNDDEEEKKKVEKIKCSINLNLSMALMNLSKYKEAIGNLKEAKRLDPSNLKTIYRMGFCYFKSGLLDDAKQSVNEGLAINKDSKEFIQLKEDILKKEREDDLQKGKMFKKVLKK